MEVILMGLMDMAGLTDLMAERGTLALTAERRTLEIMVLFCAVL